MKIRQRPQQRQRKPFRKRTISRVATRDHAEACWCGCEIPIQKGHAYRRTWGEWDGTRYAIQAHAACFDLYQALMDHHNLAGDEGQDLPEFFRVGKRDAQDPEVGNCRAEVLDSLEVACCSGLIDEPLIREMLARVGVSDDMIRKAQAREDFLG